MPEVVKFETVIPDGYERCEWKEATHFAHGVFFYKIGHMPWSVHYGCLHYNKMLFMSLDDTELIGIIPIREKIVVPMMIEFRPICRNICAIVDKDGYKIEAEDLAGKKFQEVVE
jgi:hypothetical protein